MAFYKVVVLLFIKSLLLMPRSLHCVVPGGPVAHPMCGLVYIFLVSKSIGQENFRPADFRPVGPRIRALQEKGSPDGQVQVSLALVEQN